MNVEFLVTGSMGHLGINIINELIKRNLKVKVLIRSGSPKEKHLPESISKCYGDILNLDDLDNFLSNDNYEHIVIHCAGIVSITSSNDDNVYNTNVNGTKNIVDKCIEHKVKRLVYVSSIHALSENGSHGVIYETLKFDPNNVVGLYAKTKATASKYVVENMDKLDSVIVHPSGILGPNDYGHSHLMAMLTDFCNNKLTAAVEGGYDFVDARDVAYGVVEAALKSHRSNSYLLTNKYISVKELLNLAAKYSKHKKIRTYLPLWFAKLTAPLSEIYYKIRKKPPLYTAYSLYTLESNSNFSHEKATKELNYNPRRIDETIEDSILFLKSIGSIK